ncbi:MAG: hypothetical protein Q8Q92_03510 [bacterium]|nr:hypothetical protein [bacterium]
MAFNTNGDGGAYVKYSGKNIVIGAGDADRVTVSPGNVTMTNDIDAAGGYQHDFMFYRRQLLQTAGVFMTSSIAFLSGATTGFTGSVFTRVPMLKAGSVRGVSLLTQDHTVKSGSLSASVLVNGVFAGAVGMHTGTIGTATFAKDTYTFTAGQYIEVALTATVGDSGYFTDKDIVSGSWLGVVTVEY